VVVFCGVWMWADRRSISDGHPVLIRCSNHEWSREWVEYRESFIGVGMIFWDVSGVRNHIVDSIRLAECVLFGAGDSRDMVDQDSQAP